MTTLHDRLADLAEDAPAAVPATGLWDRGTRYRRRQLVASCVVGVTAIMALAVLGSATWLRSPQSVEPLPADSPAGLPDRLYAPSPWLPGTDDAGPLGTLAAAIPASRGTWTGMRDQQVVGVSAVTGAYRFLDLPGLTVHAGSSRSWALSPDGRFVAYLYRDSGSDDPEPAATGLALYDTTTGDTRRHALPGSLGIRGDQLVWAGDTVVLTFGSVTDDSGSSSRGMPLEVWNVHVDAPQVLPTIREVDEILGAGPGFFVVRGRHADLVLDVGTGVVLRQFGSLDKGMTSPVFDPRIAQFVTVRGNQLPGPMWVGTPGAGPVDGPAYVRMPGGERSLAAYAFLDERHVALLQPDSAAADVLDAVVNSVDIRTGETKRLVDFGGPDLGYDRQLATDLLSEPTVRAVEPPRPLDPRKVTGGAAAIVLGAVGALIAWRRRVRP